MLYINPNSINVQAAEELHYQRMRCYIRRKLGMPDCDDPNCVITKSRIESIDNPFPEISNFLGDDQKLSMVLRGMPRELYKVNRAFWIGIFNNSYDYSIWLTYFKRDQGDLQPNGQAQQLIQNADAVWTREIAAQLKDILNYKWFSSKSQVKYNAYDLTKALGRDTCTYCNRSYTHTIIRDEDNKLVIRPTLDHWFPKYNHPLLAVSFYNLIPSCPTCNSYVKGTSNPDIDEMIHPYLDPTQTSDFEFAFFFKDSTDGYEIFVRNLSLFNEKAKKTLETMQMGLVYGAHESELKDLLIIQKNYTGSYIKSLKKLLDGNLSTSEVYRIAFGTEHEEKNFYKRPLSKFKHDILKQLGLLQIEN